MRLQQRTDYALRALLFLADSGGATPSAIAAAHKISLAHIKKVMQSLSAAGFVDARRGRGKITTLAVAPDQLTVGAVIQALEPLELAECFREDDNCRLTGHCKLQRALGQAHAAFLESLDGTTLAELQSSKSRALAVISRKVHRSLSTDR